jgi:antitoxin component of MazEF toxin-antitoxin module
MSKIVEEVTAKGLMLPSTFLEQWGLGEGTKVAIESYNKAIVIKPEEVTARKITKRALTFLLCKK